jgi:hypothetical protein
MTVMRIRGPHLPPARNAADMLGRELMALQMQNLTHPNDDVAARIDEIEGILAPSEVTADKSAVEKRKARR